MFRFKVKERGEIRDWDFDYNIEVFNQGKEDEYYFVSTDIDLNIIDSMSEDKITKKAELLWKRLICDSKYICRCFMLLVSDKIEKSTKRRVSSPATINTAKEKKKPKPKKDFGDIPLTPRYNDDNKIKKEKIKSDLPLPPKNYNFFLADYNLDVEDLCKMTIDLIPRCKYVNPKVSDLFLYFYLKIMNNISFGLDLKANSLVDDPSSTSSSTFSSPLSSAESSPIMSPKMSRRNRKTSGNLGLNLAAFVAASPKIQKVIREQEEESKINNSSSTSSSSTSSLLTTTRRSSKENKFNGLKYLGDVIKIYYLAEILEDFEFRDRCKILINKSLGKKTKECKWGDIYGKGFRKLCIDEKIDKHTLDILYSNMPFLGYLHRLSYNIEPVIWDDFSSFNEMILMCEKYEPSEPKYQDKILSILYMTPEYFSYKNNPHDNVAKRIRDICINSRKHAENRDKNYTKKIYITDLELELKILQLLCVNSINNVPLKIHILENIKKRNILDKSGSNFTTIMRYMNIFTKELRKESLDNGIDDYIPYIPIVVNSVRNYQSSKKTNEAIFQSPNMIKKFIIVCNIFLSMEKGNTERSKDLLYIKEDLKNEYKYLTSQ